MAKPVGWDSAALAGGNKQSSDDQILMSWYTDESQSAAADNRIAGPLSFDNSDPNAARQRALDEFLFSKRQEFRQARMNDEPMPRRGTTAASSAESFLTNLELTNDREPIAKAEVPREPERTAEKKEPTLAETRDLGFAAIRQLEGPNSASSRWMFANRPDLLAAFQSQDCSMQMGSKPDGTVFEILTSPEGYSRMLTAKGSTTVEIIADRHGNEVFKHSGKGTLQALIA